MPKKKMNTAAISDDNRWRAESDLSTLMEAEKIKSDPKRIAAAQAVAKEKMMAVAKVAAEDAN